MKEGESPALVKSPGLLEDKDSVLIKEKMFLSFFFFGLFFTHLSTIWNSVNTTFSVTILKLLKSVVSGCNIYGLLHLQR